MISIIIPIYNQADKIGACLQGIKNQTYQDYEIIVVNDGSRDEIENVIAESRKMFTDNFVFISQENQGANVARNRGWKEARGDYFLFCDADIVMVPEMLAEMMRVLKENPKASYVYSSHRFGNKLFRFWPFDAEKLKKMPYVHSTSLIKAIDFPVSGWDVNLKKFQDWDIFLTMLKNGKSGVWVDKVLFSIETGGTMSSWLPSFAYKILPFLPRVKKYQQAMAIIRQKHKL